MDTVALVTEVAMLVEEVRGIGIDRTRFQHHRRDEGRAFNTMEK